MYYHRYATYANASSSLPPEIWRIIFRHATASECSSTPQQEEHERHCLGPEEAVCHEVPTLRAQQTKRLTTVTALSLVCREFTEIASEFLFNVVIITNRNADVKLAERLARDSRRSYWVRHVILIVNGNTSSHDDRQFRGAVISMVKSLHYLEVFRMYCCSSTPERRTFEESIIEALPRPSTVRHFGWNSTGVFYLKLSSDFLPRFFRSAKDTFESIDLTGFFPFPNINPGYSNDKDAEQYAYPALRRLKISRSNFCDLALLGSWNMSENLVCLDIGTIWTFTDNREASAPFFQAPHPHLRCIHLGRNSTISPMLAKNILSSAPKLEILDYFVLDFKSEHTWQGERHDNVRELDISLSDQRIPMRSLFRERVVTRERSWDILRTHLLSAYEAFSSLELVRLRLTVTEGLGGSEFETWFKDSVLSIFPPGSSAKVIPITTLDSPCEEPILHYPGMVHD